MDGGEIREVGGDVMNGTIGENERVVRKVVKEEIMGALKKMKNGRAAGMDGIVVGILKNGGISIIDWLLRQRISSRYTKGKVIDEDTQIIEE